MKDSTPKETTVKIIDLNECGCGNPFLSVLPEDHPGCYASQSGLLIDGEPLLPEESAHPGLTCEQVEGASTVDLDAVADSLGWPPATGSPAKVARCDRCGVILADNEQGVVDECAACCPRDGVEADPIPGDEAFDYEADGVVA